MSDDVNGDYCEERDIELLKIRTLRKHLRSENGRFRPDTLRAMIRDCQMALVGMRRLHYDTRR